VLSLVVFQDTPRNERGSTVYLFDLLTDRERLLQRIANTSS